VYQQQYYFYPRFASLFIEKYESQGPLLNINKIVSGLYEKIKKLIKKREEGSGGGAMCMLLAAV